MSFNKGEWLESLGPKLRERTAEQLPALKAMQVQAVLMEKLVTQDENWNRYLSYLQELVNRTTIARDGAIRKLTEDAGVWQPADMAKLKADIGAANGMLQAWDVAMRLPKALIEDAAKAEAIIAEFEKKDEPAAATES